VRQFPSDRPVVAVVGTGGTISAWSESSLDMTGYTEGGRRLPLREVLAAIPEVADVAEIRAHDLASTPSHDLGLADMGALAQGILRAAADPQVSGLVVTHGTNTLEEFAFLLSLVVWSDKPVVLTAAMRPLSGLSCDGPLNLVDAIRTAASPQARGRGVLAVLDGTIWAAGQIAKAKTFGTHAFTGGISGPLGVCGPDGRVMFWRSEAVAGPRMSLPAGTTVPRVDVVLSYVGADGALVDASVAAGAQGIVSAGTGAGFTTTGERESLRRAAAAGVVVCQSSRTADGLVLASSRLTRYGVLAGGWLGPLKCRIVLALCLAAGDGAKDVQSVLDQLSGSAGE
jgi:L-asparaginase